MLHAGVSLVTHPDHVLHLVLHWQTPLAGTSAAATTPALARQVYTAPRQPIRFQAALVTGGMDGDELRYWADNMFMPSASYRYYCSNCSTNADCVALLLDGEVAREAEYNEALAYIRRRCRYGAAVIANQEEPAQAMEDDDVLGLVDRWVEEEVERFFQGLVQLLNEVSRGAPLRRGGAAACFCCAPQVLTGAVPLS